MAKYRFDWTCIVFLAVIDPNAFGLVFPNHGFFPFFQKTGNGLGGNIRSQVNLQMNKVEGVKQASGLRDILIPIIWFSDDVESITDPEMVQKIKAQL